MPSHIDWVREICLSLPQATEDIQWESTLLFRVARKIFCLVPLEPGAAAKLSLKCTPEKFAELVEVEGIIPAPYLARNYWVAFVDLNALRRNEIKELIQHSYRLVVAKLPKRIQTQLEQSRAKASSPRRRAAARRS